MEANTTSIKVGTVWWANETGYDLGVLWSNRPNLQSDCKPNICLENSISTVHSIPVFDRGKVPMNTVFGTSNNTMARG